MMTARSCAVAPVEVVRAPVSRDRPESTPTERRQSGRSGRLGSWSVQSDGFFAAAPVRYGLSKWICPV